MIPEVTSILRIQLKTYKLWIKTKISCTIKILMWNKCLIYIFLNNINHRKNLKIIPFKTIKTMDMLQDILRNNKNYVNYIAVSHSYCQRNCVEKNLNISGYLNLLHTFLHKITYLFFIMLTETRHSLCLPTDRIARVYLLSYCTFLYLPIA